MNNKNLKLLANKIRIDIVKMLNSAGSGHSGGALGMADIFTVLYSQILKHNPKNPKDKNRDYVILSNGHICPVLYATLARNHYFKHDELKTLRQLGSKLQGHPHNESLPGVENSGGPLGQGFSQAVGLAASLKRDNKLNKVYCFVGDGELEEGQCYEAALFAAKEKLDNLIIIIDRNHMQIDGDTEEVLPLNYLNKKFTSLGFFVIEFNGNSISQIKTAFKQSQKIKNQPICFVAKTIPGKGVSFMEGDYHWHGKDPNDEELKIALEELKDIEEKIKEEK